MKITIKDVAKAAEVSVATVSMSMNDRDGVNAETTKKVKRVAKELGYIPNYSARSLVMQKSDCIGLIVPEIINPFYSEIVDIMTKLAEKRGLTLLLGISNNHSHMEEKYIETFIFRRVSGIVIVPILKKHPHIGHLQHLKSVNIPFVFCTEHYAGVTAPCVMCDFEQGEYEMISFLLKKGIRDICFLTVNYETDFTTMRMNGLRRAFAENGVTVNEDNLFFIDTPHFEDAYGITDIMLEKNPKAIVSINDIMAIGVMKRLAEHNIRVPEDIWVVGFDDMMFASLAQTPITTVKQPLWEICGRCMNILDESANHAADELNCDVEYLPTKLVIRDTTQ